MNDLKGQRFGRLVANSYSKEKKKWECKCDCGQTSFVRPDHLRQKRVQSCGCLLIEVITKHGMVKSGEYVIWCSIIQRCYNKNHTKFNSYGGRGIVMSEAWRNSFKSFFSDMGERPSKLHSIDRIDVNGNYEKGNCRWATNSEQSINTRRNVHLAYEGISMTISEWSKKTGIHRNTIDSRLKRGLPINLIFENRKLD